MTINRVVSLVSVLAVAIAAAATLGAADAGAAAVARTQGDAYATPGSSDCTWTMGTAGIEKIVTLASGTFTMTSLKNKAHSPTIETVQGVTPSDEFRLTWDGTSLKGSSGGWSCASGQANVVTVGGEPAIQVDVDLSRTGGLHVHRHYVVYPSTSLIREWSAYENADTSGHTLTTPSFFEERVHGSDVANEDFLYMNGAQADSSGAAYKVRTKALGSTWSRTLDSYDQWGCAADVSATSCSQEGFAETSQRYMPWMALHNRSRNDGIAFGFDYHGRWQANVGNVDGAQTGVSMTLPNYSETVAAGATVTMPKAFSSTYSGDLDDMTNRLLDWQYRYMWDYTRAPYFAGLRMVADWGPGAHAFGGPIPGTGHGGPYDATGLLQKVFGYADHLRQIGGDGYHRDIGWWVGDFGDWSGPDWKQTIDYLAKSGMPQTIYYPAYMAGASSSIYAAHAGWFEPSPCGYTTYLADLSNPDAEEWVRSTVNANADLWGDYAWRNDGCPVANMTGSRQLAASAAFMRIQENFLNNHPGSAVQGVDSGGYEVNWEFVRRASSLSFTDLPGVDQAQDGGSRLFPVDKLSGTGGNWAIEHCDTWWNILLGFNPEFVNDPNDPGDLECMRKLTERYHFLKANGVVGRWVHQYHPESSLDDRAWFQRVNGDQTKSALIYKGEPNPRTVSSCEPVTVCPYQTDFPGTTPAGNVTVYPRGLQAGSNYSVTYELRSGNTTRTGSDLMTNGITLASPVAGEVVYLGMPKNPGGGRDTTAPDAPSSVTARYATNMNYSGVEITWPAGSDDNYVSRYEVFRDGTKIATVSTGRYTFDHDPAASTHATYGVRTVDADGNTSSTTTTTPTSGADRTAVDDSAGTLSYSGSWTHATGVIDAYGGTLSSSDSAGAKVTYNFTGSGITLYAQLAPDYGNVLVRVDGRDETVVDLWAPDPDNMRMPVFSRAWKSNGPHTITVERIGDLHPFHNEPTDTLHGSKMNVDGFQVRTTHPDVTEDADFTFHGAGWKRPQGGLAEASNESVTVNQVPSLEDPAACHTACQAFSSTQGNQNWTYEDDHTGSWTQIAAFDATSLPNGPAWFDSSVNGGLVWKRDIHPGISNDAARTWTAPRSGTVDIASHVAKVDEAGNGVVVKITKNGTTVAGPLTLAGNDTVGTDLDAAGVTVTAGDKIRFVINRNGDWTDDTTHWDPELNYRGDATCATACQGFGGRQGESNWRYQDLRSGTWQDISGFELHTFTVDGPNWHDSSPSDGGYIYRQYIHPGNGIESARAWVAPKPGTVNITSVPAKVDPAGNGVVVKITKNGTTIAGPRTIAGNDTIGSAMDVSGLSVGAGDIIRFQIADNGSWSSDMSRWDPEIDYTGTCATACQGFSSTQGSSNWHYQDRRTGSWSDIEAFVPGGLPAGDTWHDDTPTFGGYVLQAIEHPGTQLDTARAWVAPRTGSIDISGTPRKSDTGGGDGVVVRVTRNGTTILGPRTIPYNDSTGSAFNVSGVNVVAGDVLRFEINRNSEWTFDSTRWDPTIAYTAAAGPAPVTWDSVSGSGAQYAEATVTARDVELIGRRCSSCGIVDVSVDGTFIARVDTYGFRGPDSWQVPIWHYSWASSGSHTIRVTPTGTKSPAATGSAAFIDSLQVNG